MPNLYIVAGPNGAGKSTYVRDYLLQEVCCREFVNADVIAAELAPGAPENAAVAAGRVTLRRLQELAASGKDFSFETTLSGRTYFPLLTNFRERGYRIRLDFLWVPELGLTQRRVQQRVLKGGHDIPAHVQERRFHLGVRNLVTLYRPVLDWWRIYDNSGGTPLLLVEEKDGVLKIMDRERLDLVERTSNARFMAEGPVDRVEEPAGLLPWTDETRGSMRAMRRAYARVVLENKSFGLPVIQWRQGRGVVEVPAEQLEPLARRILEVNGEPLPEAEERALLAHVKV
ncbi:MAG: zeta toxin family protein [Opitutaceae bacterium]|nr:zeta toxin family protein [Opitutaceae bacterium]